MTTVGENLTLCHSCPRRQAECAGPCACLEDGEDIIVHARAGQCPLGKFSGAPVPPDPSVVRAIAQQTAGCKSCGDPGGLGGL